MNVIPIIQPNIDWLALNSRIADYIERSPYIDIKGPICDYRTFLLVLARISEPGIKMVLLETLDHLSFSFLVHCDTEFLITLLSKTGLKTVTSSGSIRTAVVSGTLKEFLLAIRDHLSRPWQNRDHKTFFAFLMLYFEHHGLAEFWRDWVKIPNPDGTFLLEHRPS